MGWDSLFNFYPQSILFFAFSLQILCNEFYVSTEDIIILKTKMIVIKHLSMKLKT